MYERRERVLIVDDEPALRARLRAQVLAAGDFDVIEVGSGPAALADYQQHPPDLILLDLTLPGLSGLDVLVGLRAQGYGGPLIILGDAQSPRTLADAFRLGATDFVAKPPREAEVLAAVERSLQARRIAQERDALAVQLEAAQQQLEIARAQLETLHEAGRAATQLRDLKQLTSHLLRAAIALTGADHAMLLLRDDRTGQLRLLSGENLRLAMLDQLGEPVEDPLATLVMTSREPLVAAGEGLRRAGASADVYAVVYAPLLVQQAVIGVLAVGNHLTQAAFEDRHARLLAALAAYAAMAIVSARLSQLLDQRARAERSGPAADRTSELETLARQLHQPLIGIEAELARLSQPGAGLPRDLIALRHRVRQLVVRVEALAGRSP